MEVSSTSMNVASITASATSQGLMGGGPVRVDCGIRLSTFPRRERTKKYLMPWRTVEVRKIGFGMKLGGIGFCPLELIVLWIFYVPNQGTSAGDVRVR